MNERQIFGHLRNSVGLLSNSFTQTAMSCELLVRNGLTWQVVYLLQFFTTLPQALPYFYECNITC